MANPSAKANTESYFDNPNRDPNIDITKVLDFDNAYDDIKNKVSENMNDQIINYNKKFQYMRKYRDEMFLNNLRQVNERSYVELNVNFKILIFIC
jgi:hypothetical protein